jgi:hypothetical protein
LLDCDFYFLVNTSTSLSVSDRLLGFVLSKNVSYFRLGGLRSAIFYRNLFASGEEKLGNNILGNSYGNREKAATTGKGLAEQ